LALLAPGPVFASWEQFCEQVSSCDCPGPVRSGAVSGLLVILVRRIPISRHSGTSTFGRRRQNEAVLGQGFGTDLERDLGGNWQAVSAFSVQSFGTLENLDLGPSGFAPELTFAGHIAVHQCEASQENLVDFYFEIYPFVIDMHIYHIRVYISSIFVSEKALT
jgi:hypothetical protein